MPKSTWVFAGILTTLLLLVLGALQVREHARQRAAAVAQAEEARRAVELTAMTNATMNAELEELRSRAAELEEAVAEATRTQHGLEQQMRSELESRDVTISELRGRLTVDILDRVLFDSGQAVLKPEGQEVLRKVATVLAKFPRRAIQVVGHTDNVPIRGVTSGGFADNWALSAGRAVAAVRFLVGECGVDPQRLSAVGSGEHQPISDNASAVGRAKNRRIAVVVLPEEFAAPEKVQPDGAQIQPASTNGVATEALAEPVP